MICSPETAFSIDMDLGPFGPIKLITYSTVPGPSASPPTQNAFSRRTLSKAIKNAREKNPIQLWQNIRYNPSPPFNNSPTTPLFPTIMSDSPADDTFDDHKLPDELDEGAQLGNSDSGQSPIPLHSSATIDKARPIPFRALTCTFRRPTFTCETRARSSQGQQKQEECCRRARVCTRSFPSGWREAEEGEAS